MRLTRRRSFTRAPQPAPWLRAPAPSGGDTFNEPFTGTDGVGTPPTGWTKYEGFTTVHQTFQGNRWQIQTNGGFEGGAMSYTAAAYTDVSFAITLTHPTPAAGDTYSSLGVRISGNHDGWDTLYCEGYNGYLGWIDQTAKTLNLAQMTAGAYDAGQVSVAIDPALCALGASVRIRLEAVGTTVRARAWDPAGAEPATWDASTTYTGYSTGFIGFRAQPQSAGFSWWDDAGWTDLSVPVSTLGRPKVWTGLAWALKPMKVWSGSAWIEKPVKWWDGIQWRTVGGTTVILNDPLETLTNWSGGSLVAGRNGNGMQLTGTSESGYSIPVPSQGTRFTASFSWRTTSLASNRTVCIFRQSPLSNHVTLVAETTGALSVRSGGAGGLLIGTATAAGLIAINTYYTIEFTVILANAGAAMVKLNGTQVIVGSGDTFASGTGDLLSFLGNSGGNHIVDDFVLTTP